MLAFISWTQYWIFVCLALVVYYSLLWERYYRGQMHGLFRLGFMRRSLVESDTQAGESDSLAGLLKELDLAFRHKQQKEELLLYLAHRLRSIPNSKDPDFRAEVEDWLLKRSIEHHSIHLEREEVSRLWNRGMEP